jgi:prolyl-tRNA editing enzyme YbaK/EbsC (Cys-tRNA(Pro) deacylase)
VASSTERVAEALRAQGLRADIREFPHSTRTAAEAAAAIGTTVGQIVKSLVFFADGRPVLVLASGAHRVDPVKLAGACGAHAVRRATADEVRQATGFAIGGVPPIGHPSPLATYLDQDLLQYEVVYAAAGTPVAIFAIAPDRLQVVTAAVAVDLSAPPGNESPAAQSNP